VFGVTEVRRLTTIFAWVARPDKPCPLRNDGADLTFATFLTAISQSERQIQASTRINGFWWSHDSNIGKSASLNGMRMLESDH